MSDPLLTHLQEAAGESSAEPWNEDYLPFFFQRFRPRGDGVDIALSIIPDGSAYVARLLPVYQATAHPGWESEAYFIVRQPIAATDAEVAALGEAFLTNLRLLGGIIEDNEFSSYLDSVTGVRLLAAGKVDRTSDDQTLIYETVGDFFNHLSDHDDAIPKIREAFYTIACDPELTRYLQWPYFKDLCPVDIFEPYFQLWRRGYDYAFKGNTMFVGKK